jgi:hypothetical protein
MSIWEMLGLKSPEESKKEMEAAIAGVAEESRRAVSMKAAEDAYTDLKKMEEAIKAGSKEIFSFEEAMKNLGVETQPSVQTMANWTVLSLQRIEKAYQEGKATALDYSNALTAANKMLKETTGEGESGLKIQKQIDELWKKYDEDVRKLDRDSEDYHQRQKALEEEMWKRREELLSQLPKTAAQIQAEISEGEAQFRGFAERSKIMLEEISKEAITPKFDTSKIVLQMGELEYSYNALKDKIEINPIRIKIEKEQMDFNTNLTATGLSPKIPLGQAFEKIMKGFSTIEDKAGAMESIIRFENLNVQLNALQKQYDMYQGVIREWAGAIREFTPWANIEANQTIQIARSQQTELFDQMRLLRLQMAEQQYLLGMPGAEREFLSIYGERYRATYQSGTPYVPRTGLYVLHQGERVINQSQNLSMGGMVVNFHFHGSNPKQNAEEMAKVLKYELSGNLKQAIREISRRK